MKPELKELRNQLFEAIDGEQFSKVKDQILKYKKKYREDVIDIISEYVKSGSINHMRKFILWDLVDLINENEEQYAALFEYGLSDKELAYWSIEGLLKAEGSKAYGKIVDLVKNSNYRVETRGKAIKELSMYSGQKFDRGLLLNPGHWKADDLRVSEVIEWANDNFPKGEGYKEPQRHPSLEHPTDEFETIVTSLDRKLAKLRAKNQNLAHPTNWLTLGDEDSLSRIRQVWTLPLLYDRFLECYSPLNVMIEGRKFINGLELFGVHNLIDGQIGYAYNVSREPFSEWPLSLLVVGQDNGDPFCLDLSRSNGEDAPVVKSVHGEGNWVFKKYSSSFKEFLQKIQ